MILSGKTAIVTGGARDIGRAISLKLASLGANVVINYFNKPADGEETLRQIEAAGGKAVAVRADVTSMEGCQSLVDAAHEKSSRKWISSFGTRS